MGEGVGEGVEEWEETKEDLKGKGVEVTNKR